MDNPLSQNPGKTLASFGHLSKFNIQYILVTVGTSNDNLCIVKAHSSSIFPKLNFEYLERPNLQGLHLDFLFAVFVEGNIYAYISAHEKIKQ